MVPLSRRRLSARAQREVPREAKIPAAVLIGCGGAALAFMSGWVGVTVGVVVAILALFSSGTQPGFRRVPGAYTPALILVAGLAAGVLAGAQPWLAGSAGVQSVTVQALTLLAFTLACAAAFRGEASLGTSTGNGETSKRRSRRPRRMMGRSIRR
jgi:hypothetical protein